MQKLIKILPVCILIFSVLFHPLQLRAATIGMAPSNIVVHVGESFKINFTSSGKGASTYTVQINAKFTPGVVNFSRWQWKGGENLIPLKTAGYNVLDNATGTIVQTTGFIGGFSDLVNLAEATFTAQKEGETMIVLTPNSFTYDENGTNTYVPGQNVLVKVQVLPAVKKPVKEVKPIPKPVEEIPAVIETPTLPTVSPAVQNQSPKVVTVQIPVPTPEDIDLFNLNNLTFLIVGLVLGIVLVKLFEYLGPDAD